MVHAFEWLPDFIFYTGAGTEEEELEGVAELEGEGDLEVEGVSEATGELDAEGELEGELDADAGGKKLPSLPSCATRYITAAESTIILSIPTKAAIYSTYLFYKCLSPL
jgi:hypothetical protein